MKRQRWRSASKAFHIGPVGFTLIELLVVLAIGALLVGMVAPRLADWPRRIEQHNQRAEILDHLENLGYRAYAAGKSITLAGEMTFLDQGRAPFWQLPSGWRLRVAESISYTHTGVCGGGELSIVGPDGAVERLRLEAPACSVRQALLARVAP